MPYEQRFVSKDEMRALYNERVAPLVLTGELIRFEVKALLLKHPHPLAGCHAVTCILRDPDGRIVAYEHAYLRPDESRAASGRYDPTYLLLDGVVYKLGKPEANQGPIED